LASFSIRQGTESFAADRFPEIDGRIYTEGNRVANSALLEIHEAARADPDA